MYIQNVFRLHCVLCLINVLTIKIVVYGKISAIIEDTPTSSVIMLGDFNADVDTGFKTELMCDSLNLIKSDSTLFDWSSVSGAHNTTSWLDHIICSDDLQCKFESIDILDKLLPDPKLRILK